MTIRALYPWSDQWVPVSLRKDCLYWHDGPVGLAAQIEIEYVDWAPNDRQGARQLKQKLEAQGYRNVRVRGREEANSE